MQAPDVTHSTPDERSDFVRKEWECMHSCELCGKCHILRGRNPESLYAEYIDGAKSYMEVTLDIRQ